MKDEEGNKIKVGDNLVTSGDMVCDIAKVKRIDGKIVAVSPFRTYQQSEFSDMLIVNACKGDEK